MHGEGAYARLRFYPFIWLTQTAKYDILSVYVIRKRGVAMIEYEHYRFGEKGEYVVKEYDDFHYPYLHFHRNYEFVYIMKGKISVSIDGTEHILCGGQFILLFPNQIHAFASLEKTVARVCIFSPKLIQQFYQEHLHLCPEKTVTRLDEKVEIFVTAHLVKGAEEYAVKACLYAVCAEIVKQTKFVEQTTPKNFLLIHRLITYVAQNFKTDLTLQTIAKEFGYSYQYLSNYLRKHCLRFTELLHQHRLDYAKHLLKNSSLSVTEIAFECGYNSVRTFNRNFFIAFSVTPLQYKKS